MYTINITSWEEGNMSGQKTLELIKELVSIPSPTGNTYDIIDYINRLLQEEGVETKFNRKGA